MASIDQIIQQAVNPFDAVSSRHGNFWTDRQDPTLTVNSIHQDAIDKIELFLDLVARDHQTRTLLLYGDSGSGKSYLLGRLKQQLNPKAFFAYIGHCSDSQYILRHVLRQTVDSLVRVPDGKRRSQLLLWLQGLSALKSRSMMKKLLGERTLFIRNFSSTYPVGIYNPHEFFGVLYNLTKPDLYHLACQWLKGDDLDEESLKALRVRKSIDSEYAAQKILENFGRIADKNRPIVLCFDQLDHINLPSVFSVNTNFHNENLKNFLVIISLVTDIARQNSDRITQSDKARINARVTLKSINLDLAEELWRIRLHPLHIQANPKPELPIYPLSRQQLETEFPGGKTNIRNAIALGKKLIDRYMRGDNIKPQNPLNEFKIVWNVEFQKQRESLRSIYDFSSFELVEMLEQILKVLQVENLKNSILVNHKQTRYSFQYQQRDTKDKIGVIWSENANLTQFCSLMKACQKEIDKNYFEQFYLIRAAQVGKSSNKGYQIYQSLFSTANRIHIRPHLKSLYYLATYTNLLNASRVGELQVGDRFPNVEQLQNFVRQSKVLQSCSLLQELNLFTANPKKTEASESVDRNLKSTTEHNLEKSMLRLLKIQNFLSVQTLIEKTREQTIADSISDDYMVKTLQKIALKNPIQITGHQSQPESWFVYWIP